MKITKKYYLIINFLRNFNLSRKVDFFLAIFISIFCVVLFSYSLFLKISNTEETDLFETVSLKADVAPEFDSQGIFWWLLEGSNNLILTNYSNEKKSVELNLIFENNPCTNLEYIKVNNVIKTLERDTAISTQLIEINAYEDIKIEVINVLREECTISNDTRKFGSKLRKWFVR